jgi:hypothetical protein
VSIGEALSQARRQAGLTIAEVSDRTQIKETIITGIEGNDFSACADDSGARGYIRSIADAVGADPAPLIWEYDTSRSPGGAVEDDITQPITPVRTRKWLRLNWVAVLVLVWLGLAAFDLHAGLPHATGAAPSAGAHPVTHHSTGHGTPAPKTARPAGPRAHPLTPVTAAAFSPYGTGHGDHADLAHFAIDGRPRTSWHTDWYATARLGNLYPGTGLLVDLGRPKTITAARITLGRARGADFRLCVGNVPVLADLPPVAHVVNVGGVVRLRLTRPARGRYVLIWFTSLPPIPANTFRVSVYNLQLEGRA